MEENTMYPDQTLILVHSVCNASYQGSTSNKKAYNSLEWRVFLALYEPKSLVIFFFISLNTCFGCSKEPSHYHFLSCQYFSPENVVCLSRLLHAAYSQLHFRLDFIMEPSDQTAPILFVLQLTLEYKQMREQTTIVVIGGKRVNLRSPLYIP